MTREETKLACIREEREAEANEEISRERRDENWKAGGRGVRCQRSHTTAYGGVACPHLSLPVIELGPQVNLHSRMGVFPRAPGISKITPLPEIKQRSGSEERSRWRRRFKFPEKKIRTYSPLYIP